jgi:pyrroline-5-carboxylate reductase
MKPQTCKFHSFIVPYTTCDFVFAVVYSGGSTATSEDLTMIQNILSVVGISEMVPESLINAAGAVAGSGPAFVSMHENFLPERYGAAKL